ncbi:ABC transporter permease [Limnohabitans sp.]|jgi:NitT/TauT family transport system permease protein|uniref:ABC transporter permease n=1 Tax=Limnohabitans sp. TaxID=1907725 RepID=UPI00262344AC|nr:ABC transporter permease [Limnohabitans sp.]
MKAKSMQWAALHAAFMVLVFGAGELASRQGWINPTFFGRPSGVALFLWENLQTLKLWTDLMWTMTGVMASFVLGSVAAFAVGLAFVRWPRLEQFSEPYLNAINVMPRIALAPLFILWFGLGLGSKIAVGFSLTFFIVLSSTVAGIRSVSQDHMTLCKTLGTSAVATFFQVTLPGAVPVIFSGLRLGLTYALFGVIGAEIIASEKGLGQTLAYLSSIFDINGVMALLLILALLGVGIVRAMTLIEKRLLHWQ